MHSLTPALTLTLTLTLSLNHLANKQLRSTNALYSLINGSSTDYEQLLVNTEILTYPDVICCDTWLPYSNLCEQSLPRASKSISHEVVQCRISAAIWNSRKMTANPKHGTKVALMQVA